MMRTLKVIVGGEGNVGKTSLIRQYASAKFSEARHMTIGIDITTQEFTVDNEKFKLMIWDIAGQAGNRESFYIGAQAALLVYDVTNSESLQLLSNWVKRCRQFAPGAPIQVIGNKLDLGYRFPENWGEAFAKYIAASHFKVSAKTSENVSQAFENFALSALNHVRAQENQQV